MFKQSNSTSELVESMLKNMDNTEKKETKSDFVDQVISMIQPEKPQSLSEIFAQVMEPEVQPDLGVPGPEQTPLEEEEDNDPVSLLNKAIELLNKAQEALGGTEPELEMGENPVSDMINDNPLP